MTLRTAFVYSLLVNAALIGGSLFQRSVHADEIDRVLDEARDAELVLLEHIDYELASGEPERVEALLRFCRQERKRKQAYDNAIFERKMASLR